jgi:hypothetical protein
MQDSLFFFRASLEDIFQTPHFFFHTDSNYLIVEITDSLESYGLNWNWHNFSWTTYTVQSKWQDSRVDSKDGKCT